MVIQISALGSNIFPFIMGSIFADKEIFSYIYSKFNNIKFKNILCLLGIFSMLIFHGIVETAFVATFIGIVFIILFNLINIPNFLNNILYYLSKHSTNLWLIHMFFYIVYFRNLVFMPKYPVLIFIWLLILCLASSYIVNIFYKISLKNINHIIKNKINSIN